MVEFEHPYLKGKSPEQMVDELGELKAGLPGNPHFEMYRMAIQAELADRLAAPRRWALIAAIAAAISAAGSVASAIAAF